MATAAQRSLMILVAGLYRSGTGDDPAKLDAHIAAMEAPDPVLVQHRLDPGELRRVTQLDLLGEHDALDAQLVEHRLERRQERRDASGQREIDARGRVG